MNRKQRRKRRSQARKAKRHEILKGNQAMREGVTPGARRLEEGEVTFRIPTADYQALLQRFPDLGSKDHTTRLGAWHSLRQSELGEKYLVTRTPRQVRRSQAGIIIK
jgi:hypothetical protein